MTEDSICYGHDGIRNGATFSCCCCFFFCVLGDAGTNSIYFDGCSCLFMELNLFAEHTILNSEVDDRHW